VKRHRVSQGETLDRIAAKQGLATADALSSGNQDLLTQRKDPNVLHPGDEVSVPEVRPKWARGTTEKTHRFRRRTATGRLRLKIVDDEGQPAANRQYELRFDDQVVREKTSDGGFIEAEIPMDCERATLRLWIRGEPNGPGVVHELRIGHLDPTEELTGLQARLANMKLYRGEIDGVSSAELESAIRAFRKRHRLPGSGDPDDQLIAKLREIHGS